MTGGPVPLRVELLGTVRAWRNGAEVDLGTARRRAVFALLALRAGQTVSKDELIDGVWGDSPPQTVNAGLHTYVSGLRQALEPDRPKRSTGVVLTSSGAGYCLRVPVDGVDVHRFERHRDRARELADRDPALALAELEQAHALWRGEALSGVSGPFAQSQRSRLHELRLATAERRAELALVVGRHEDVIADLAALTREHPVREALRALLMTALHRAGRQAEALEVYHDARRVLVEELGMEPGAALRQALRTVLEDKADDVPAPRVGASPIARPSVFVGRDDEVDLLRAAVDDLAAGRGGAVWVGGEPGIGKSALLATGLDGAVEAGCRVAWAAGDEFGPRTPLRVLLDCLDVTESSADPRRAALAKQLRSPTDASDDPVPLVIERLLALVHELCAEAPLVIVVDDLHWVDEAGVLLWHRLLRVVRRTPLLLVAAARPVPRRADVEQVRRAVAGAGGRVVELGPLSDESVAALLTGLLGAPPGRTLRALADLAAGNPLYTKDLVDAVMREDAVEVVDGQAETTARARLPHSLVSVMTRRLGFLSPATADVLRSAALLGDEFALGDAATALGRTSVDLVTAVEEATAAGVLDDGGPKLAFRHPVVRRALYLSVPAGVRAALHRQAAGALADAGAPVELVVGQLAAAPEAVDEWAADWLVEHAAALARRASDDAIELLRAVVSQSTVDAERRERLAALMARLLFWLGRQPQAAVRYVLARTRDPDRAAGMRWIHAYARYRDGEVAEAADALRAAVEDDAVPPAWRARLESLLAVVQRDGLDDVAAAEQTARRALRRGEESHDDFAVAHALHGLWQVSTVRRDHAEALAHVDRALDLTAGGPDFGALRAGLLDGKVLSLQNLDRLDEADDVLRVARAAARSGGTGPHVSATVQDYWRGRWDRASTEADVVRDDQGSTAYALRERGPLLLLHGVAALIAARRGWTGEAEEHLRAAAEQPLVTPADREHGDFLLAAWAVLAEGAGQPEAAIAAVEPLLTSTPGHMVLRHQWLPDVARMAVRAGRRDVAERALAGCFEEAARERVPGRAWAAEARCRGLVEGDPAPVLDAVARYRAVGRPVELAEALEDAAVLLVARGELDAGEAAFREALAGYGRLGAVHDVRRARARMRDPEGGGWPGVG